MNKNFKHKPIATKGCEALAKFFQDQKRECWHIKYHTDLLGVDAELWYYLDTTGVLQAVELASDGTCELPEDYVGVTTKEFIGHYKDMLAPIKEEKEEKVYKTTHAEMGKIYNVACDAWQEKLEEWCKDQLFNDGLTFTESQVKLMFKASDRNQQEVVLAVFPDYAHNKVDLRKLKFQGEIFGRDGSSALVNINISDFRSFFLNPNYAWEIGKNGAGYPILTPTKKH